MIQSGFYNVILLRIIALCFILTTNFENISCKLRLFNNEYEILYCSIANDTSKSDTVKIESTSIPTDTIAPYIPLLNHGSVSLSGGIRPFREISKYDIQSIHYSALTDILGVFTPSYPLSTGSFGQFNHISLFGGMPVEIAITYNGRRLNDADYGTMNPDLIPVEFMESAEIFVGTDAVIFSGNASGAMINIQEVRYNTGKPYTRLWLSQAGGSFYATDGIFSQNFSKNWNATFGFRRMSYPGRFDNSGMDSWNVRGLLRWNLSDRINISLSDIFTNHKLEVNGGIDEKSSDYFDPIASNVLYEEMSERNYRHDLTLSISTILDADTSLALSSSLFFTNNEFHRWREEESFLNESDSIRYYSKTEIITGFRSLFELGIYKSINLKTGCEILYINSPETIYNQGWNGLSFSVYGMGVYSFEEKFELKAGARISNEYDRTLASFGTALRFNIGDSSFISGDLSVSQRMPTLTEGTGLSTEKHILGLLIYSLEERSIKFNAGGFARIIYEPILNRIINNAEGQPVDLNSYNGETRRVFGFYGEVTQVIFYSGLLLSIFDSDNINYTAKLQIYTSRTNDRVDRSFPNWYFKFGVEYQAIVGRSQAIVGIETKLIGENYGYIFFPQKRGYVVSDIYNSTAFGGIDAYISLKLGNANVRLMLENILSNNYYYLSIYPQLDRNLRFSVSWPFFD